MAISQPAAHSTVSEAHGAIRAPIQNLAEGKVDIRSGTVKTVRGEVTAIHATRGTRQLKPGDAIAASDLFVTGPHSAASVVLRDGTTLMIGPDSKLEISGFTYDATTQKGNLFLSILRGSMRMITGLIGKTQPDAVKIITPTSVIGVLGTDFIVEADGGAL